MNISRKAMEWLTCFSIVNLKLRYFLFKQFKKFIESCSLSKAAEMSSTIPKKKVQIFRLFSFNQLDS